MLKRIWIPCLVALAILTAAEVCANTMSRSAGPFDITFFDSEDDNEILPSSAAWETEQMDDIVAAIQPWSNKIKNTPGRQIKLSLSWFDFGDDAILGGSYSPTNGDGATSWTYAEHIWRDGVNYDAPWVGFDALILLNPLAAGYSWNYGQERPAPNEIDFRTVVTHEIGHTLGFSGSYDPSPEYDDWGNAWGTQASPFEWAGYGGLSMWDKNLIDSLGNRPASGSTGSPENFCETAGVYWGGNNALESAGSDVRIYAPYWFQPGSSIYHLDEIGFPDALMSPYIGLGQMVREPTGLEWAMMQDMGWSIVVLEPSSFAIVIVGLCVLMFLIYCHKRRVNLGLSTTILRRRDP